MLVMDDEQLFGIVLHSDIVGLAMAIDLTEETQADLVATEEA